MARFNKRSWLINRFKGLYPGVREDLDGFDDDWLEETVYDIDLHMIREPLDFDTEAGVEKLKWLVDNHIKVWNEANNG